MSNDEVDRAPDAPDAPDAKPKVALLDENNAECYGKFLIPRVRLNNIAYLCQDREFSEEVDKLEESGGEKWLEEGLRTDFKNGITGQHDDLFERDCAFGNNRKPEIEPKGYIELLLNALEDFTMKILIVASFASIIIETATADDSHRGIAWIEGFAIFVAVGVCANVTALNDYQKERQFQKLNKVADDRKRLTLVRQGQKVDIHQSEVMVGDIVQVFEGMEIPADSFIIEASELTSDESAMTGETDPVKKNTLQYCIDKRNQLIEEGGRNTASRHEVPSPILMSGTRVLSGEGKILVLVVGDASCVGKISALLRQDEPEATPLQMKLEAIAEDIGKFGLISAVVIVIVLIIRFGIEKGELLSYFIIGITVVVVAIPEGLPLAVTLSLAFSTKKMLDDKNLVRKMAACETMGGASMICSDKTGTLTQNKMSLVTVWNDELIELDSYSQNQDLSQYFPKKDFHELFIQCAIVNGTAMLRPEPKGSKTEIAFLEFIEKCGFNYEKERDRAPASLRFPFSSSRKRMSMILELEGGKRRLVNKGASEMVLAACNSYHSKTTGVPIAIDDQLREKIEKSIETMAGRALRTICLAYRDVSPREDFNTKDKKGVFDVETHDLTLIAVLGIKDLPRPEVPRAITLCRLAGIKVRMVTGDNQLTARAIAKEIGIIEPGNENSLVMEGPAFIAAIGGVICKNCRTYVCHCPRDSQTAKKLKKEVRVDTIENQKEFDRIYPHLDVLARSRPEDKYALVTGLIERGNVVAVTGDGTNDAPALKKADVGFAMGIAGTEVAREAAAIILLDDNFNSIVKAVMWGRNIYDSIKKFLQFQLTVNVVAVFLTLIGAAIIKQEVLKPIQMLWINLIMDTFASLGNIIIPDDFLLALATEPPTEKLLYRKPHNRNEYIVTKKMFKHIVAQSMLQLAILLIIVFRGDQFLPEFADNADTSTFLGKLQFKYSDARFLQKGKDWSEDIYTCIDDNPDDDIKYCTLIASGRLYYLNGDKDYRYFWDTERTYSRHFTYLFNVFVMLQLSNFFNARRILDELNVFEGILRNNLFIGIVIFIFSAQIIILTFTGIAFGLYSHYGLNVIQWLISIGFGCLSIPFSFLLKFIKEEMCWEFGSKEVNPLQSDSKVMQMRQSNNHNALARRYSSIVQQQYYNSLQKARAQPGYQPIAQNE